MHASSEWMHAVVCFLLLCCVFPIAFSSHFLGGNIIVRPKRGGTNSEMEIISHISWKRSNAYCNSSLLANSNHTINALSFTCQYGCTNSISLSFLCIEYSIESDWSYLEGHGTYIFACSDTSTVTTLGTLSGDWIAPFNGNWNISTTFSRAIRADTGRINSPPVVTSFPYLYLQGGSFYYYHSYTIPIAVSDPDNDIIRCRWATGVECRDVCSRFAGAYLDSGTCTIYYDTHYRTGLNLAAIMIEDFLPSSYVPLSSVAHQFVVEVVNSYQFSCHSSPWFTTPSPSRGSCIHIPPKTPFKTQLRASSSCSNLTITSIQVIAPIGTHKGELQHVQGTDYYYTNITWMPTADQQNYVHFLCFVAVSSENLTSEQSCVKLAAGYHPPTPLIESATQVMHPSNITLQITFDSIIQHPSSSAFIRFYKAGTFVYQIDTLFSTEVTFNGYNLTITPNLEFTEGNFYYINFDEGVVKSGEGCNLLNEPILNETFWIFGVIKSIPDVIAVNNQTEGQPLILQCSVTTVRNLSSRVDFAWISNGIELRRVEGFSSKSTVNNLETYSDHYIIPQLSTANNNTVYKCEVTVKERQPVSVTGNITLNITGTRMMDDGQDNNSTFQTCPRFDEPTLPQGSCIAVPPGTLFIKQIMATSGCSNVEISSIKVFAPNGTSVGELQHVQGTNHYYSNVAWIPTADQQNDTHFLCSVAVNSAGLSSEPFCMHLAAGHHPPAPIPESATHQLVYPSNNSLHVMFDRKIQCPSTSGFIRFYEAGKEIYLIDASVSMEITCNQSSLTIVPNYTFAEGSGYYITFDRGVVQSVESTVGCQIVNEPILSNTFWSFEVIDLKPGAKAMDTICDDSDDNCDGSNTFLISFGISAGINLLLVAIVTLTCLLMKRKKRKSIFTNYRAKDSQYTTRTEPVYEVPTLERQEEQKEDYVNLPQRRKEVELPTIQKKHVKSDANMAEVKLEGNPSYCTTHYNNL